MKKSILAAAVFLLLTTSVFGAETIVIATGEWAPYTSEKMEGYGFCSEIVTSVFNEMGVKFEYRFYPWKRCEILLKTGKIFAIFPYRITDERKKNYDFTDAFAVSRGVLFYLKSKKQKLVWENFSDLKGYMIGGTLGYWYEKNFKDAGLTVEYVSEDIQNIKKLKAGRVDLVASEELVGWNLIKMLFPKHVNEFDTAAKPLDVSELHLMISRKYPGAKGLREKFNAALKRIKEKGIYSDILRKYNINE